MRLTERLRANAHAIWEANFHHPFVQGIGDGTLPEEKFRFYLTQDYAYLIDFCRFLGIAAAKSPDLTSMALFSQLLDTTLRVEMDLHRSICADFGISPQELENVEPAPLCLAYTSYLLRVAYEGSFTDVMVAFLPCSWGYVEIGRRIEERGVPEHPHYAKWIETYSSEEFWDLNEELKDMVDRLGADVTDAEARRLQGIFDFSSRWERLFWDMAWNEQTWVA